MAKQKNILLLPVGSAGDVYPHLGLGRALRERGHRVTLMTSGYFRETAEREGFEFVDLLPTEQFLELVGNPLLWHPLHGTKAILETYDVELLRIGYQATVDRYEPGNTVAVTSCLGLGARIAHDHVGIPLVTIDLQPMVLWSAIEPPVLPGIVRAAWVPNWFRELQLYLAEKLVLNPMICPTLNSFRKELDLPPVSRAAQWMHSPQCILGTWPPWYGGHQADWPPNVHLSQFPIWTERSDEPLPDDVEEFLSAGDPPIVFTPGSANMFGRSFFEAATAACQQLSRRGMLFSKFEEHIPDNLPEGIRHFRYAPFQQLLPRTAAISHHGGIGTVANALAAGIPQLIMPLSHDQPDNALRLKRLGVGDSLRPKQYRGPAVAERLNRLLSDPAVATACQQVAERFVGVDPFREACEVIESCIGADY